MIATWAERTLEMGDNSLVPYSGDANRRRTNLRRLTYVADATAHVEELVQVLQAAEKQIPGIDPEEVRLCWEELESALYALRKIGEALTDDVRSGFKKEGGR